VYTKVVSANTGTDRRASLAGSLVIAIATAAFAVYYGYEVFYRSIYFNDYKYLGVISSLGITLALVGFVLGIIGLKSAHKKTAGIAIALSFLAFFSLVATDLKFFPASAVIMGIPGQPLAAFQE
jgi:hypothetical protein